MNLVYAHHVADTVIHISAVFLNAILFVVIHTTTTKSLEPYKRVFKMTCINDFLLGMITFITQPAIFVDATMMCFVNNGFVAHAAPSIIFASQVAFCGMCMATFSFLPVPFLYRYHTLCRGKSSLPLLMKLSMTPITIALCAALTLFSAFNSQAHSPTEKLRMVIDVGWPLADTEENALRIVCAATGEPWTIAHCILNTTVFTYGFLCIGWSEYKMVRHIRQFQSVMSPSARKIQQELHYALIAMAVCPLVAAMIPSSVFLASFFFGFRLGEYSAFLSIMVSLITLANPITTCYIVRPYRRRLLHTFCLARQPQNAVTPENVTHQDASRT